MTASIIAAHIERLRAIDPLLPKDMPMPSAEASDAVLSRPGGVALATARVLRPDNFIAVWNALETHSLDAKVTDVDVLAGLLDDWEARLAATGPHADADARATITWPSRDVAATPLFLAHGFTPVTVFAARSHASRLPEVEVDATIRQLEPGDAPEAARLWHDLTAWDNPLQGNRMRTAALAMFTEIMSAIAADGGRWTWIAEAEGEPVGLLRLMPPEEAGWVNAMVATRPMAYLGVMYVAPGRRGAGVGTAMVRTAHAVLAETDIPLSGLHYSALNPLSGPFWHRCGYRPLWTMWARRPVVRR